MCHDCWWMPHHLLQITRQQIRRHWLAFHIPKNMLQPLNDLSSFDCLTAWWHRVFLGCLPPIRTESYFLLAQLINQMMRLMMMSIVCIPLALSLNFHPQLSGFLCDTFDDEYISFQPLWTHDKRGHKCHPRWRNTLECFQIYTICEFEMQA